MRGAINIHIMKLFYTFMRIICLALTMICCFCLNSRAEEAIAVDSCARFEILGERLCDFGNISNDTGCVSSSFRLKSVGNVPLIIVSSTTSCPCTVATYNKDIIEPGDSVEIKMTYHIQSHLGGFLQSVLLKTNTKPEDYVWFYMKGCVVKGTREEDNGTD
jgi:hypothetical protein